MQDNTQERFVDLKSAIVMNEAQFPEFIHEKVDSGARRADHLRQHFLRYFGVNPLLRGGDSGDGAVVGWGSLRRNGG